MAEQTSITVATVYEMLDSVRRRLNEIGFDIVDEANRIIDRLWNAIQEVLDGVRRTIEEIQGLAGKLWDTIKGVIDAASGWIADMYERILDALSRVINAVSEWIADLTLKVFDAIKTVAETIYQGILAAIEWIGNQVKEIVT